MSAVSLYRIMRDLLQCGTLFDYERMDWRRIRVERRKRCIAYLTRTGRRLGFDVCPNYMLKVPLRQYLVDLCWISWGTRKSGIELAVELEWGRLAYDVRYDFSKLMNIKAPSKLMVCAPFPNVREKILHDICQDVRTFKWPTAQEKYGIIFFAHSQWDRSLFSNGITGQAYLIDSAGEIVREMRKYVAGGRLPPKPLTTRRVRFSSSQ